METQWEMKPCHEFTVLRRESRLPSLSLSFSSRNSRRGWGGERVCFEVPTYRQRVWAVAAGAAAEPVAQPSFPAQV